MALYESELMGGTESLEFSLKTIYRAVVSDAPWVTPLLYRTGQLVEPLIYFFLLYLSLLVQTSGTLL